MIFSYEVTSVQTIGHLSLSLVQSLVLSSLVSVSLIHVHKTLLLLLENPSSNRERMEFPAPRASKIAARGAQQEVSREQPGGNSAGNHGSRQFIRIGSCLLQHYRRIHKFPSNPRTRGGYLSKSRIYTPLEISLPLSLSFALTAGNFIVFRYFPINGRGAARRWDAWKIRS